MKDIYSSRFLAVLLILSGLLLSSLVPGGPIENRDFSHISTPVLLAFNVLLTALVLGSFFLAVLVVRGWSYAGRAASWAAMIYIVVYGIDLLEWFPTSPTSMSSALLTVEVLGTLIALPMLLLGTRTPSPKTMAVRPFSPSRVVTLGLGAIGLFIVAFSTLSAMGV